MAGHRTGWISIIKTIFKNFFNKFWTKYHENVGRSEFLITSEKSHIKGSWTEVGKEPGSLEPDRAQPDFRARAENWRANRARAESLRDIYSEKFRINSAVKAKSLVISIWDLLGRQ